MAAAGITLDRVRGMFIGAFLGDALGAPHEFKGSGHLIYTGKLEHVTIMNTQFQGQKHLAIGQVTDDSEMSLALLRTLIQDRGYNRDHVIMAYLDWANSGGWMMGKNTRALLKGVKTIKGYQNRMAKILALPLDERSQSNGTLMRCSPLALIWDNNSVIEDVNLTNPHPVNLDCGLVYVSALRLALQGVGGQTIYQMIKTLAQTDAVKEIFIQVEQRTPRDIKEKKGWCLHALWCTLTCIYYNLNYEDGMNWIISSQPGSDTDTNACIAGALLGAIAGFETLRSNPITASNIDLIIGRDPATGPTPRPSKYSLHDFYALTEAAHALTL
jgi:ADP-ribosylglycohydrolase